MALNHTRLPFRHIRLYIKLFFDAKSSCNTWPLSTHTRLNSPLKRRLSFVSKYLFAATYRRTSHSQNFCTARNTSVFPVEFPHSATSACIFNSSVFPVEFPHSATSAFAFVDMVIDVINLLCLCVFWGIVNIYRVLFALIVLYYNF